MTITTIKTLEQKVTDWGHPREWPRRDIRSPSECFSLESDELEKMQLQALQERFIEYVHKIPAVADLAVRQDVTKINSLDDIIPILFTHTVYKSYPLSLIEKKRFDQLTKWISKFTTLDLSGIKLDKPKTIDAWLDQLEAQSELLVVHSSGTIGKLSFLPRTQIDMDNYKNGLYMMMEATTGINFHEERVPVFFPGFRNGRQLAQRVIGHFGPQMAGSEEEFHTAMPGFMSADFMSLAGRVRAAKAKGELGKLQLIRALVHNKGEFIKMKMNQPKYYEAFIDTLLNDYAGKRVFFMGVWQPLIETALAGHEKGLSKVFAPDSGLATGGGMKGYQPPKNWYEITCDFYGVDAIKDNYGMTEMNGAGIPSCDENHYHIFPWIIPYILDPDTGAPLPRSGIQTGRFAFYDLLSDTYWGGFVTGDEVTIHWNNCGCGWKGAWLEKKIHRYSEKQQGDDKISCAGVQASYDDFIDFLNEEED
ncbi:MAG: LuxE/PaaK family acyltransferase [Candidatus Hodarchaeales archaeon]